MQAYFELARARYAMGVHSISPAQFSSQLEATKRIRVGNGKAEAPLLALEEDGGESLGLRRRSLSLTKQHAPIKEGEELAESRGTFILEHLLARQHGV